MKKTWIKIKRGLLEPKHRRKLGAAWFLYFYMLDKTNWDDGTIYEWKDEAAAEELQMQVGTLREQRRKLEDELYIQTLQKQYSLEIKVNNWTNPREYSGQLYNPIEQGEDKTTPQKSQGIAQGDAQGAEKAPPLHLIHRITESHIDSEFDKMKNMVESKIGHLSTGRDEVAINKFIAMGVIEDDIINSIAFFKDKRKVVFGASQILNSVEYQVLKRTQSKYGSPEVIYPELKIV